MPVVIVQDLIGQDIIVNVTSKTIATRIMRLSTEYKIHYENKDNPVIITHANPTKTQKRYNLQRNREWKKQSYGRERLIATVEFNNVIDPIELESKNNVPTSRLKQYTISSRLWKQ